MVGQHAADGDPGLCIIAALAVDAQPNLAVVEQDFVLGPERREHFLVRQADTSLGARRLGHVEAESVSGLQRDLALGETADAQLGALQVGQDGDGAAVLLFDAADSIDLRFDRGVVTVTEVEAENVGAAPMQSFDLFGGTARRTESGDDLGVTASTHGRTLAPQCDKCQSLSHFFRALGALGRGLIGPRRYGYSSGLRAAPARRIPWICPPPTKASSPGGGRSPKNSGVCFPRMR